MKCTPHLIYFLPHDWDMAIQPSETTVTIVGLGYVGLPTALSFHEAGFSVRGIDVSDSVISSLNSGKSHFKDDSIDFSIPVNSDRWEVGSEFQSLVPDSDVVLITVPTPVYESKNPDLSFVRSASRSVLENINPDSHSIVALESTVFPGVTREVMNELCEDLNLSQGENITIAYSPERVSPGDPLRSVAGVARIVGCDDREVGLFLAELYSFITSEGSSYVGAIEVAEAAKLIENVQRDIDIAFANELATLLPKIGLDVEQVLDAASTKWNFHRHNPGLGVGGHCIPVDPYYYLEISEKTGNRSPISQAARRINESMPGHSASEVLQILKDNGIDSPNILVLGYSYKPETGDTRDTPVKEFTSILSDSGSNVLVWDPFVEGNSLPEWVKTVEHPLDSGELDMVVMATAHSKCLEIDWRELSKSLKSPMIYDGRRALSVEKMQSLGWEYFGIGFPNLPQSIT